MLQKTKIILWAVGAVALLIILVALLVVFRRPITPSSPRATGTSAAPTPSELRLDEIVGAIFGGAPVSKCQEAGERAAVDHCFFVIAMARFDDEFCDEITDLGESARCHGELTAARVAGGGDVEDCLTVIDVGARRSCILKAVDLGAGQSFCNEFNGEEHTFCLDRTRLVVGLAGNSSACEGIVDEGTREECFGGASPRVESPGQPLSLDTDGDGLLDNEEARYGSDPNRVDTDDDNLSDFVEVRTHGTDLLDADSDGDGFSDGTEVANGYNPKGPGRLQ